MLQNQYYQFNKLPVQDQHKIAQLYQHLGGDEAKMSDLYKLGLAARLTADEMTKMSQDFEQDFKDIFAFTQTPLPKTAVSLIRKCYDFLGQECRVQEITEKIEGKSTRMWYLFVI